MKQPINSALRLSLALFCCGFLLLPARAQTTSTELSANEKGNLIEALRLPAQTQIAIQPTFIKPSRSYTVFLGTRYDFEVEQAIKSWLARWNATQAKKYGRLILTDDLQEADIVLVQYLDFLTEIIETLRSPIIVSHEGLKWVQSQTNKYSPLHSYILVPQADGFAVHWQRTRLARYEKLLRDKTDASGKLMQELSSLLKKSRKNP